MAYVVSILIEILEQDQYHLNLDIKPRIQSFLEKVRSFRNFLLYPHMIPAHLDRRIVDAAHKAEDAIEVHTRNQYLLIEYHDDDDDDGGGGSGEEVSRLDLSLTEVVNEFEFIKQEITKTIIDAGRVSDLPINHSPPDVPALPKLDSRRRNNVAVFEDDFQTLKARLIGGPSKLQNIPVIGVHGIGKRTLAQRLYNDSLIANHFETRVWLTGSFDETLQAFLLSFLDELGMLTKDMRRQNVKQLSIHVRKALKNRKYFIVFYKSLLEVNWLTFFPDEDVGSRILYTAIEIDEESSFARNAEPHQMRFLNDSEAWLLLCQKVFGREHCPDAELELIGKQVVKECKGYALPLSLVVGILATSEETSQAWEKVASFLSKMLEGISHEEILELVVGIVIIFLPHYLKPCLYYTAAFSESCDIQASKIIKMWVAEGFVKQTRDYRLEDLAETYLNILIDKNIFYLTQQEPNGRVKAFRIHNIIQGACIGLADKDKFLGSKFFHEEFGTSEEKIMRRVSVYRMDEPSNKEDLPSLARSFLSLCGTSLGEASMYLELRLLRVVDVFQLEFFQFPVEIMELVLLRYLAFSCHSDLPTSFSKLLNLQTLIIRRLPEFRACSLPYDLWELANLRHVKSKETFVWYYPISGKRVVHQKLQTLSNVQLCGTSSEFLGNIPNIQKLGISCNIAMHNVLDLACLDKLEKLKCSSDWSLASHNFLSYLTFPPSLRKLTLRLCKIHLGLMKVVGSLPNLEQLKLQKCDFMGVDSEPTEPEWEPTEGEYPRLLSLDMVDLNLVHWKAHAVHFPKLRLLSIQNCYAMVEIPLDFAEIQTLEQIHVNKASHFALASAMQIKKKHDGHGNKLLQVHIDGKLC